MVRERLKSDLRHCYVAVAEATGTLDSVRRYSRINSYALIVNEAI